MNKKLFLSVILVLTLVLGMAVVGSIVAQDANSGGGTLTITNIPSQYNGKYAMFSSITGFFGCESVNMSTGTITCVRISNGRVNIPMWIESRGNIVRYSGNGEFSGSVLLFNSATQGNQGPTEPILKGVTFETLYFSNGNATKSWEDGKEK